MSECPMSGRGRVLVVEDEPHIRHLVARVLTRAGYDVVTRDDGASALEAIHCESSRFQVVLTDIVMPRVNGFELATAIREVSPCTGIVMMTGFAPDHFRRPALMPEVPVLVKPFTSEALLDAIGRALPTTCPS